MNRVQVTAALLCSVIYSSTAIAANAPPPPPQPGKCTSDQLSKFRANAHKLIGRMYRLKNENLLESNFSGGFSFYKNSSIQVNALAKGNEDRVYLADSQKYLTELSSVFKAAGKTSLGIVDLAGTLNAEFSEAKSESYKFSSYILGSRNIVAEAIIPKNSRTALSDNVLEAINALPTWMPNTPDWSAYENFFEKYGSYVLTGIEYGSVFDQWEYAAAATKYEQSQLSARACADVKQMRSSFDVCVGLSSKQIAEAETYNMKSRVHVRGGSVETRSAILDGSLYTSELGAFLKSACIADSPAVFKFSPVWELISELYPVNWYNQHKVAVNMAAYNLGVENIGCTTQSTGGQWTRRIVQDFEVVQEKNPRKTRVKDWLCLFPLQGCHNDDSCHIGGAGSICYCYGDHCIGSISRTDYTAAKGVVQSSKTGNTDVGANKSCTYRFGGNCGCNDTGQSGSWRLSDHFTP